MTNKDVEVYSLGDLGEKTNTLLFENLDSSILTSLILDEEGMRSGINSFVYDLSHHKEQVVKFYFPFFYDEDFKRLFKVYECEYSEWAHLKRK